MQVGEPRWQRGRTRAPAGRLPRSGACALALAAAGACGCAEEVLPERPQIVVVVDTDAPLTVQALADGTIAPDAAVDTLRVDVFDPSGENVSNYRDFVVADPREWPVSFGIPPPPEEGGTYGAPVLLRIRLFRAEIGDRESLLGQSVLEPLASVAIDRVVRVEFPSEGVARVGVMLSFDCFGVGSSFRGGISTCIDGERPSGSPDEAIVDDPPDTTKVGTSLLPREVPCSGAPPGKACIPGGFAVLGDPDLVNLGEASVDARPTHAVRIAPFALDDAEVTVGEFRTVSSLLLNPLPSETGECQWTAAPGPSEGLPLNCVLPETAEEACQRLGERMGMVGHLPSEAQWELAARGRGKGWRFPWGDAFPGCCVAASGGEDCDITSYPTPRSHPPTDACAGLGDRTPEGVFDLGGGLSEFVRDKFNLYDEGCWSTPGILLDPVCTDPIPTVHTVRGGSFLEPTTLLLAALRRFTSDTELDVGFRCAYEVGP